MLIIRESQVISSSPPIICICLLCFCLIFLFTSLFAAQAGASRVIAIEASDKMAAVATQVNFTYISY